MTSHHDPCLFTFVVIVVVFCQLPSTSWIAFTLGAGILVQESSSYVSRRVCTSTTGETSLVSRMRRSDCLHIASFGALVEVKMSPRASI
ncbi:Vacuolar protein-sorting-associated protein 36 [Caligus rogercresseyi]|uniref:Vacuolar protein-sorting-associated protein 36 n=1 Tax=Caligus rogercresseyi TaxID=217165 RepID=A0A7T8HFM7_CALRO|nr:Vacuolar protein-sorting-associated protein 36 [Caligus rogercresseyi]